MPLAVDVVWFKRYLRLRDHAPLAQAIGQGRPLILRYVHQPSICALPDHAPRRRRFVEECLTDMQQPLAMVGRSMLVCAAEMITVLEHVQRQHGIQTLHGHAYETDALDASWSFASSVPGCTPGCRLAAAG